jgi:hypothetical protein
MKRSQPGARRSIIQAVITSSSAHRRTTGYGTYWIEAGETCGGLCGHGGTYVFEETDGTWASTGSAPGTGSWIS